MMASDRCLTRCWHSLSLLAGGLFGLVIACDAALAAPQALVSIHREGGQIIVFARAEVAASPRIAWETVSDYERLPDFIPNMSRSRVLERHGDRLTVEQRGEFRFLFFSQPIDVRMAVQQFPISRIEARAVPSIDEESVPSIKAFEGRYEIVPAKAKRDTVLIAYSARIVPAFDLPPVIGMLAVRHTVGEQFAALLREIERRAREAP